LIEAEAPREYYGTLCSASAIGTAAANLSLETGKIRRDGTSDIEIKLCASHACVRYGVSVLSSCKVQSQAS
jgi:formylmethanofuran dehydrogenase subunit E